MRILHVPFSIDRFWALEGTKLACLEIKDGGSNMAAKKVISYYSSTIGSYDTWVKLVSSCHLELSFNWFFKQSIFITLVYIDPLVQKATFLRYHGNQNQNPSNFGTKASKITCKTVVPFNHLDVPQNMSKNMSTSLCMYIHSTLLKAEWRHFIT